MPVSAPSGITMETAAAMGNFAPRMEQQKNPNTLPRAEATPASIEKGQAEAARLKAEQAEHPETLDARFFEKLITGPAEPLRAHEQQALKRVDPTKAQEVSDFDAYSSIVEQARNASTTVERILEKRTPAMDVDSYMKLRRSALDTMRKTGYFSEAFKDFGQMDTEEQDMFVEGHFAAHPRVRELYMDKVTEVIRQSTALPDNASEMSGGKSVAQIRRESAINTLRAKLGKATQTITDEEVLKMFGEGMSAEAVRLSVMDRVLKDRGVDPQQYHTRENARADLLRLKGEIAANEAQTKAKGANIAALAAERATLDASLQVVQKIDQEITASMSPTQESSITESRSTVYGQIDTDAGVRVGGVIEDLRLIQQRTLEMKLTEEAQNAPLTVEQTILKNRLSKELTAAMGDCVNQVLKEEYEEAVFLDARKVEADAAREAKEGNERMAQAERHMLKREDHDWVGQDRTKRKRTVDRGRIGKDIKRVAYDKAEGVERIMLRQLTTEVPPSEAGKAAEPPLIYLTTDGKPDGEALPQLGSDGKPKSVDGAIVAATWETVQMSQLSETDRKLVSSLYEKQHVQLEDRLLRDFDFAKNPRGKLDAIVMLGDAGAADLKLTDDEYGMLYDQFGDRVDKGSDQAGIMRDVHDHMEKRGVKPSKRLNLLLSMAGAFGVLGALMRRKNET